MTGRWPAMSASLSSIDDIGDVSITSAAAEQRLIYDGTVWKNSYQTEKIYQIEPGDFTLGVYTIPIVSGIYHINANGLGDVTVKLPDSAAANDNMFCRIIAEDIDAGSRIEVTTVGGTQLIGSATSEFIVDNAKGLAVESHFNETKYLIVQDSRGTFPNDANPNTSVVTTNRMLNTVLSTGIVSGFAISQSGALAIDVAAGEIVIRPSAAGPDSQLKAFSIAATTALVVTDLVENYVVIDYNSGTPIVDVITNPALIDGDLIIAFGSVFPDSANSVMNIYYAGGTFKNFTNRWALREFTTTPIRRVSGSILSTPSTYTLATTAGSFYSVLSSATTPALDTSGAGRMVTYYKDVTATWFRTVNQTVVNHLKYNDKTQVGAAALANISPTSKFGVAFAYWRFDDTASQLCIVYGTAVYGTPAEAEAAARIQPTDLPPELSGPGLSYFIGSMYWQASGSAFIGILNVTTTSFTATTAATHNNLAGLQGGTTLEYYHTTALQNSRLAAGTSGQVSTTDATVTTLATVSPTAGKAYCGRFLITAFEVATGDSKSWVLEYHFKNIGGTASVGKIAERAFEDAGAAAWAAVVDASGASVRVRVTGEAAHNIAWSVTAQWSNY